MTPVFWAIVGVGVALIVAIDDARKRIERKLDTLIDEVRYPNREAQMRDMLGDKAYDEMKEML